MRPSSSEGLAAFRVVIWTSILIPVCGDAGEHFAYLAGTMTGLLHVGCSVLTGLVYITVMGCQFILTVNG